MKSLRARTHFVRATILAVVLALGLSLVSNTVTRAAATAYSDLDANQRALSAAYVEGMKLCIDYLSDGTNHGMNDGISADSDYDGLKTNPANGYWFQRTTQVTIAGEKVACNALAADALKNYWGYGTDYYTFLKDDLHYVWTEGKRWQNTNSDSAKLSDFLAAMKKRGIPTTMTDASRYSLYLNTFLKSCKAEQLESGKPFDQMSSSNQTKAKNDANIGIFPIVTDGAAVKWAYKYIPGTTLATGGKGGAAQVPKSYSVYGILASPGKPTKGESSTCAGMITVLNKTASAFATAIQQDACTKAGFPESTGTLASICRSATQHKDEPNYCQSHYPDANSPEQKACLAGQNAEIGDVDTGLPIDGGGTNNGETTCAIEGIGWIICPAMNFMASIGDTAFSFLATTFLETDIKFVDTSSGVYTAWQAMRSFANVAFVVVFLVIIFSQLTSLGVSNYGVKKLLPRLVIAAILVNISFFVCQIAVDVSNILGYSLKGVFDNIGTLITTPESPDDAAAYNNGEFALGALVTVILAGGVSVIFALSFPVILSAILALVMIVLILFARTALIILLIIISPIAFVAFLLPNTESWFKKWLKVFSSLLLLFPIIAVVFGASGLAAKVIYDAAAGDELLQLVALGVAAVPLFAVPSLLNGALKATGSLGATVTKGLSGARKGAVDKYKNSEYNKFREGKNAERDAYVRAGQFAGKKYNPRTWLSNANARLNKNRAYNAVTGGFGGSRAKSADKWRAAEVTKKMEQYRADGRSAQQIFNDTHQKLQTEMHKDRPNIAELRKLEIEHTAARSHVLRNMGGPEGQQFMDDAYRRSALIRPDHGVAPPSGVDAASFVPTALDWTNAQQSGGNPRGPDEYIPPPTPAP